MHPSLQILTHRPWPLPNHNWTWRQSWLDLAFIHYRVDPAQIVPMLPAGMQLQQFCGSAWVGLVPFRMAGVMRRPFRDLPHFSTFPEMNLRTYVEVSGKPGVWFFSLDAASWLAVFGGRHIYHLPYYRAKMDQTSEDEWLLFSSVRRSGSACFRARYRPKGAVFYAERETFEHWATERYCLYSHSEHEGIARVEVHHAPWPLQRAEVAIDECSILSAAGLQPTGEDLTCHFSTGVHVVSFAKELVT